MAVLDYRTTCELTRPVSIKHLNGMFFSQDVQANRIVVSVVREGSPENLSGTISANIIRADGATVAQTGTIEGNVASVTMPEAAYAIPGAIAVFVKHTQDGATSTLAAVTGYVYKSTTDTIVDPGTIIPSIQDLISSIEDATEDLEEAIAAIPQDYQDLEDDVSDLKNEIDSLEGGTTGQVLRKKSNTDLDVEWADNPNAEEIATAVDDWLDDHPEATTTVDFAIATKVFPTVAAMIADMSLKNGDNVATRNYYAAGDNGGTNYVVSSSHSGVFYIELNNGLYANRLSEKGVLPAESIGIKAYAAATENPNEDDMDRNVTLFNLAHYNQIFLMFGRGHYYFSSPLRLEHVGSHTIQGIDRNASFLHFPNSDGIYFCEPRYYNYYVIRKLRIYSYGHCIVCDESCLTVLDSRFEWLILESETGDCFHAPSYNVAHYITQGGVEIYDTCVQNCVFDFINASAPAGAAFCNIMGMSTYYKHINFVSCKYAFRNCDGTIIQTNTLGDHTDYFIYYDKVNTFSLKLRFEKVNAESLAKAFIYTEPYVNYAEGEDTKKPENANMMAIVSFVATNSSWSLMGAASNHDIYPITVHSIDNIELINSDKILIPSRYPEAYDTDTVKAPIKVTRGIPGTGRFNGVPDFTIYGSDSNQLFKVYGDNNSRVSFTAGNNGNYNQLILRNAPTFNAIYSNLMYGGKSLNVWEFKASEVSSSVPIPPDDKIFFDTLIVDVDTSGGKRLLKWGSETVNSIYPGRIITIANKNTSLNAVTLSSANNPNVKSYDNFMLSKDCLDSIILYAGESVQLMLVYETNPNTGAISKAWRPIDTKHIQNDPIYEMMYNIAKETSGKNILSVSNGYYIKNDISSGIDVQTLVEGKVSNANYGIKNVLTTCQEGDEFTIINGHGGATNTILWSFVNASGGRLTNSGNLAKANNTKITAPATATHLIVNSYKYPIVFKSN